MICRLQQHMQKACGKMEPIGIIKSNLKISPMEKKRLKEFMACVNGRAGAEIQTPTFRSIALSIPLCCLAKAGTTGTFYMVFVILWPMIYYRQCTNFEIYIHFKIMMAKI